MNPLSVNFYICPPDLGLAQFCALAERAGAQAVGLTLRALDEMPIAAIRTLLKRHGLAVSSLNSAGYFLYGDAELARGQAKRNAQLITSAAELEAQTLVVIAGGIAHGTSALREARAQVTEGIGELARAAAPHGVNLGLEMIHPLGVLQKGCINTIASALALAREHNNLGLTLDFFHSWWDPDLYLLIETAVDKIRLVQFCNIAAPDDPAQFVREEAGQGLIEVASLLADIRAAGFGGYFEFEMFPEHLRGRAAAAMIEAAGRFHAALAAGSPGI